MKYDNVDFKLKVDTKQLDIALEKAEKLSLLVGKSELQNRFKSGVLWTTILGALLLLLGEWGLYDLIGIKQESIKHTIDFILLVLTGFGIINSPDNKNTL